MQLFGRFLIVGAKLPFRCGLGVGERWGWGFWVEEPVVTVGHRDAQDDIAGI